MDASIIYESFKSLSTLEPSQEGYHIIHLPACQHKLGISNEKYPIFFIKTTDEKPIIPDLNLDILSVDYNQDCTLIDDNHKRHSGTYSLLTLRNTEPTLQRYFIEICLLILEKLREEPSRRELATEVDDLIAIFTAIKAKGKKTVQGLWAELLVIETSKYPEVLINAWHSSPSAKYDFTLGGDKIEVKSTSGDERVHHFSIDQLLHTAHSHLVIASTFVRESGQGFGGLCINDLYQKICKRVLNADSRFKLQKVMAETIGRDYTKLNSEFFDYVSARDTMAFYDSDNVPRISREDVPTEVSKVEFDSNLSGVLDIKSDPEAKDFSSSALYRSIL
ncbi:MAG: PD-(D/E)XK motif protein [Bacteroidales bacterium]|nr:PD-(D/E)XK motif protein [Bacteroidales bacterium]